jgi:hypothetical protein
MDTQAQNGTEDRAEMVRQARAAFADAPEQIRQTLDRVIREADFTPGQTTSAGRIGKREGMVSELTVIVPISKTNAAKLRILLKLVNGNFQAADQVGSVHDMRFLLLDGDTKVLFATAYDGDWDAYIDDFATKIPDLMDLLFGTADGWPGIRSPKVKDYIVAHQHTADGWYVANPTLTVPETRRLLRQDQALKEFLDKIA